VNASAVHFGGPCPFLTCLETGPHEHPVCPECGAVRYGNFYCPVCRRLRALEPDEILRAAHPAGPERETAL